jgi:hypothetical protein
MSLADRLKQSIADQSKTTEPAEIVQKVKEIGDQHQVNPPKPADLDEQIAKAAKENNGEADQCGCGSKLEGECGECNSETETKSECPTCGKMFKQLSRHKCKEGLVDIAEDVEKTPQPVKFFDLLLDIGVLKFPNARIHHFADIIRSICAEIVIEKDVTHWRELRYGEGAALLAGKLEKLLQKQEIEGMLFADTTSPEGEACRNVLIRYARTVVQAIK